MKYTYNNLYKSRFVRAIEPVTLDKLAEQTLIKSRSKKAIPIARGNSKRVHVSRIRYLSNDHEVVGFIIEPKGKGPYPVIIYNRGGVGEHFKIDTAYLFIRLARIAAEGYIVFASQYSGNDGSEGRDEFGGKDVDDVLNLIPIIDSYKKADPPKIGMYGQSRGGLMTYLALTKTARIKAAAVGAAVTDLEYTLAWRPELRATLSKHFRLNKKSLQSRSAVQWPDQLYKKTPLLIMHGTADRRVPASQTLIMAEKLLKLKFPYRLILFEGVDHFFTEAKTEWFNTMIQWFHDYIRDEKPLPNMKPHGI